MNNLLLDEPPLMILPKLAEKIGLNESIILQQIHYWIKKELNFKDNYYWVYNTYDEWQEQFPFWGVSTIRRTITSLESNNLIFTGNYNKAGFDKTKWYTINYDELETVNRRCVQNEQTSSPEWTDGTVQNEQTNTLDYSKTTTKTTSNKNIVGQPDIAYKKVIDYLNLKTDKSYKSTTPKTQNLIKARINEGFTEDDCVKVIDIKVNEWQDDDDMKKYLRPETLFGTKFEGYLNQDNPKQTGYDPKVDAF